MVDIEKYSSEYFENLNKTLKKLNKECLATLSETLIHTYKNGGTVYVFGNGGSAANASHIVGDMVKGISYGLEKRFKAVCLNDNTPAMMAIANDISYDDIFVEQLKGVVSKNDMVIGLSGSGNSLNVVKALEHAKEIGAKTVALCGYTGGKIKDMADISIHADIHDMEIAEDIHLIVFHCTKQILMQKIKAGTTMGSKYDKRLS